MRIIEQARLKTPRWERQILLAPNLDLDRRMLSRFRSEEQMSILEGNILKCPVFLATPERDFIARER